MLALVAGAFLLAVLPTSFAASCEDIGSADLLWGRPDTPEDPQGEFVFGPVKDSNGNLVLQLSSDVTWSGPAEAFACSDPGQEYIVGYVTDSATESQCLTALALNQNTTLYQSPCVSGSPYQNFQYLDVAATYPLVFLGNQAGPTTGNTDYLATLDSNNVLQLIYLPGQVPTATSTSTPTFQLDLGE